MGPRPTSSASQELRPCTRCLSFLIFRMGTISAQSPPRVVGKVKGYVHDNVLCSEKARTDAGSLVTIAACVTACMVTPPWGVRQPSFLDLGRHDLMQTPRSQPRLPDFKSPGVVLRGAPIWNLSLGVPE